MKITKILAPIFFSILIAPHIYAGDIESQRFALKASVGLGTGDCISLTSPLVFSSTKSGATNLGIDFGYKLCGNQKMDLELNLGAGYQKINTSLSLPSLDFSYNAGPEADMDGNRYVRYYELSNLNQELSLGYFTLPIYLTYNFHFGKWVSLHADAGVRLGFKMDATINRFEANSYCYGIYPEYDDLRIDANWINNFGNSTLDDKNAEKVSANDLNATLMLGVGAEIKIVGPVYLNVGVRYLSGFSDIYKKEYDAGESYIPTTSPVSYTVADGECVRSLTGYATKSKMNNLEINAGLTFRF